MLERQVRTEKETGYVRYLEHPIDLRGPRIDELTTTSLFPEQCDYPDVADALTKAVLKHEGSKGILICGTGIGMSIAANKVNGIRCALCHDHYTASMCRKHNDANVIAMGERVIGIEVAKDILDTYLGTDFEGGRHKTRVEKMMSLESKI